MYLREIHKEIIESRGMAIVLLCKDAKRMFTHKNRSQAKNVNDVFVQISHKFCTHRFY